MLLEVRPWWEAWSTLSKHQSTCLWLTPSVTQSPPGQPERWARGGNFSPKQCGWSLWGVGVEMFP